MRKHLEANIDEIHEDMFFVDFFVYTTLHSEINSQLVNRIENINLFQFQK